MKFRWSFLTVSLAILCFIPATSVLSLSQENTGKIKTWTSKEGREIEAKAVGFDSKTKKVVWELRNGSRAQSPLDSLSDESRTRLAFEPAIWSYLEGQLQNHDLKNDSSRKQVFSALPIFAILVVCLVLLLAVFLLDYLSFKIAIRILAEPWRDLAAYGKQFLVAILLPILITPISIYAMVKEIPFASIGHYILQIVFLVILLRILMTHYQISVFRAIGVSILRGLSNTVLYLLVFGGIGLLGGLFFKAISPLTASLVDNLLYRPTGMLP